MFDDLRPKGSAFDDDDELETAPATETVVVMPRSRSRRSSEILVLGMTAFQRLIIATMLFLDVTVLGAFLLLATEAVVLPPF